MPIRRRTQNARARTVPSLQEREKKRAAENPRLVGDSTGHPGRGNPKNKRGKVLHFPQDGTIILESKDTIYRKSVDRVKAFSWLKISITFVVILLGGVGSAALQARNTNIQRTINQRGRVLIDYQSENFRLETQLQERYSHVEIERLATELGMAFPDRSQVVEINVPRVGGVTLNTADYALPRHNYFWQDVRNFLSGLINQIFGG